MRSAGPFCVRYGWIALASLWMYAQLSIYDIWDYLSSFKVLEAKYQVFLEKILLCLPLGEAQQQIPYERLFLLFVQSSKLPKKWLLSIASCLGSRRPPLTTLTSYCATLLMWFCNASDLQYSSLSRWIWGLKANIKRVFSCSDHHWWGRVAVAECPKACKEEQPWAAWTPYWYPRCNQTLGNIAPSAC